MIETYSGITTCPEIEKLWAKLLQISHDAQVARRLVEYERRRSPNASLRELIADAIWRLARDRGVILSPIL